MEPRKLTVKPGQQKWAYPRPRKSGRESQISPDQERESQISPDQERESQISPDLSRSTASAETPEQEPVWYISPRKEDRAWRARGRGQQEKELDVGAGSRYATGSLLQA